MLNAEHSEMTVKNVEHFKVTTTTNAHWVTHEHTQEEYKQKKPLAIRPHVDSQTRTDTVAPWPPHAAQPYSSDTSNQEKILFSSCFTLRKKKYQCTRRETYTEKVCVCVCTRSHTRVYVCVCVCACVRARVCVWSWVLAASSACTVFFRAIQFTKRNCAHLTFYYCQLRSSENCWNRLWVTFLDRRSRCQTVTGFPFCSVAFSRPSPQSLADYFHEVYDVVLQGGRTLSWHWDHLPLRQQE